MTNRIKLKAYYIAAIDYLTKFNTRFLESTICVTLIVKFTL
jgi:hypothetical protein